MSTICQILPYAMLTSPHLAIISVMCAVRKLTNCVWCLPLPSDLRPTITNTASVQSPYIYGAPVIPLILETKYILFEKHAVLQDDMTLH